MSNLYVAPFIYKGGASSSSREGLKIQYIVVHWTANKSKGANAIMHDRFYRNSANGVSAHYTVDSNQIIQSVGDSRAAWCIGQATTGTVNVGLPDAHKAKIINGNTLSIEMCVNSDGNWSQTRATTVELVKNLMVMHKIPANKVIRHYDAQRISNSGQLWRKDCPGNMSANNWADWKKFKQEITEPMKIKWDLSKSSQGVLVEDSKADTTLPTEDLTGTPIIGKATTTVKAMQEWAKSKNADSLFVELAQTFYDVSVAYSIDPAVTYAQSAKETGFMKFGGVLDKSFCNPCGLKTSAGGGNYDKNAHTRFKDWKQGITAQVQHLGIYAGEIYKEDDVVDPRHFPEIRGTAPTVEKLGGKWAPSKTYGSEIVAMMKQFADSSTAIVERDLVDFKNHDTIISLMSEGDLDAGRLLSAKFDGVITFSGDVSYYEFKRAGKKIIAVGGNKGNHTSYADVLISGANRYETLEKVKEYIKEYK